MLAAAQVSRAHVWNSHGVHVFTCRVYEEAAMNSNFEKLGELIKDMRIAMLTTVEPDSTLHTRPLTTLKYANDGEL